MRLVNADRSSLPTGTVTFLFTDIEGSTELLRQLGREGYRRAQDQHSRILRAAVSAGGGVEIRTEGDSLFAVFPTASSALGAAVEAQRGLAAHAWPGGHPIRVRMGLHTGEGVPGGDDYVGIDVNRAARIATAGHGGQVVLSETTRLLVGDEVPADTTIRDLGRHGLKGLDQPERLHDLVVVGLDADFPPLRTKEALRTNLPSRRTSFVGREREVAEVDELLGETRLLTLTGPGGIGKTRLALETASEQLDRFPDGAYFVPLSSVTDPALVSTAIARVLKVREAPGRDLAEGLRQRLAELTVLLVLDNLEQLAQDSSVIGELLDAAPGVTVLATSRIALRLAGESEYEVDPLELPEEDERDDVVRLAASPSMRLFVDRAAAVRRDFVLTDANAPAIAEIVRRLDGLPLALELAASRLRVMEPAALAGRLERRLPLLTGGARDLPDRHRTLAETIRWSYDILQADEQRLFARLSVFAGGWTLEAAEAVCGDDEIDVLEGLGALVDDSMVRRRELPDGALRLTMLETLREFASERLGESDPDERALVERRHAAWYRDLAEEAEPQLTGERQLEWLMTLEREQDNLRVALDHAELAADPADVAYGLRTATAIWRFWQQRANLADGRSRLERLLALPAAQARDAVRARALGALGAIDYWLTSYDRMQSSYEEAVSIARELGDPRLLSRALFDLSFVPFTGGRPAESVATLQEALAIADETDLALQAQLWSSIGFARLFAGDATHATEPIERGIALQRVAGERLPLCESLLVLAGVSLIDGDIDGAAAHLGEATAVAVASPSPMALATVLQPNALLANHQGRSRRAAVLSGAWARLEREHEIHFPEVGLLFFGDPALDARAALGDEEYDLAFAEGEAMTIDEMADLVSRRGAGL